MADMCKALVDADANIGGSLCDLERLARALIEAGNERAGRRIFINVGTIRANMRALNKAHSDSVYESVRAAEAGSRAMLEGVLAGVQMGQNKPI